LILIECGHTICKQCVLSNHIDHHLKCLECGFEYIFESISHLPTNRALLTMQSPESDRLYTRFSSKNQQQDNFKLTSTPQTHAGNFFPSEKFESKPLASARNFAKQKKISQTKSPGSLTQDYCKIHDKPIEGFCETDKHLICVQCVFEEHKNHDIYTLSRASQRHMEKCESLKEKVSNLSKLTSNKRGEVGISMGEMNNNFHRHNMRIKTVFDEFRQALMLKQKSLEKG
jgi:hypothetical protein